MQKKPGMNKSRKNSYRVTLTSLKKSHPETYALLQAAEANRQERLNRWLGGLRLRGFEELITHLDELSLVYKKNRRLRGIAFLITRARKDFETGLEATLSGIHSVSYDSMRDVMEIEFLLREFYYEPGHITEWLKADERARFRRFRPAVLRQRQAARLKLKPSDMSEAQDYRGHSMMLHVSPYRTNPFSIRGIVRGTDVFIADSCFWEIFEHGRRLLSISHKLRRKLARHLKAPLGLERGLKSFKKGWEATRQMQIMFMTLVEAAHGAGENKSS